MNYEPKDVVPLMRNPSEEIISKVCRKCPFFETKAGNEPVEIQQALQDALELEEIFNLGIVPSFSDVIGGALTLHQIAALKGLKLGRTLADKARNQDIQKKIRQQANQPSSNQKNASSNQETF